MTGKLYEGDAMTYETGDANLYNNVLAEGSSGAAVIGTDGSVTILGVVDTGWVEGKKGTSGDPYASGVNVVVSKEGVYPIPVVDGETIGLGEDVVCGGSGKVRAYDNAGGDTVDMIVGKSEGTVDTASSDTIKVNLNLK